MKYVNFLLVHLGILFIVIPVVAQQPVKVKVSDMSGRPAGGVVVYLSARGSATMLLAATSDKDGVADFKIKRFSPDKEIIVQVNNRVNKGYSVKLLEKNRVQADTQAYVVIPDTMPFYGKPSAFYQLVNYVKFTTMEDVLREYVTPVGVKKMNGMPYPFVFDELRRKPFEGDPLLLVNGVPVFDIRSLMDINPFRVVSIAVVASRYFIGGQTFDGIINVVTRSYDLDDVNLPEGALLIKYR